MTSILLLLVLGGLALAAVLASLRAIATDGHGRWPARLAGPHAARRLLDGCEGTSAAR